MGFTMTAKEYLKEYKELRILIKRDEARLKELEGMKDRISANTTDERVQSSTIGSKVERLAVRIADLEQKIVDEKLEAVDKMNGIHESIDRLEDVDEQIVLELRYIRSMSFVSIARELCFSSSKVYRVHRRGVENLSENIPPKE